MLSVVPRFLPTRQDEAVPRPQAPSVPARPSPPVLGEFRAAPRLPAARVPSVTAVRVSPGNVSATLVNISESGALIECRERLRPGTVIELTFEGAPSLPIAEGRVVRNAVSSITTDGRLRHHVGIAFSESIPLDACVPAVQQQPPPPEPHPILKNRW